MGKVYKKRGVDYKVKEPMYTLPSHYYHSPAIYEEEKDKIFYKKWLLACRAEEVPAPGDYVIVPVCDESIVIVRGRDLDIHAHYNVCRHRGTQLCQEVSGHFRGEKITCPYHAWTYELDGTLFKAPLMEGTAGFNPGDNDLYPAHVATWGGFVFINLADDPAPFEDEMGALIGRFEDWDMPSLRIAHHLPYMLECNWKLILQNYQECYHCPGVHPMLSQRTPFRSAVHDCMEGSVIGGYMVLSEPGGSMTMDGKAAAPPVCNVQGDDLQRIHYYSIFPNMLLSPHPDFVMYHRIRPVQHGKSVNDCFFLLAPEVIDDIDKMKRFASAIEFWDMTNLQDWTVCEQMQKGMRSRRFERGKYAESEDILHALDKELLKVLGHRKSHKGLDFT